MKITTKLLSLLNNCSENKEESARVQLISEIIQSSDYRVLQNAAAIQRPFVASYSVAELEKLDNVELDKRKKLLHKLVSFYEQLRGCIQSGNGPMLSPDDTPDFTSEKSISRLLKKISLSNNKTNYSNIDPSNALAIFDASTVKSAQNCFDSLPVSLSKRKEITESDITNSIGDTLYCIDISEFASIHKHFLEMSKKGEEVISAEKTRRRKHRLFKIAVVLLCFGVIFAFSQFGIIADTYTPALSAVAILAAILYLIWG